MKSNLRRTALAFFLMAAGPAFLYAANETTVDDLIAMSQAHLSDATILLFVEKNQICLPLSSADLTKMQNAGLSRLLIDNLVDRMANCQADESVPYDDGYLAYPPGYYSSYYYPYYGFGAFPSYFFFDHHHNFFGGHDFGGDRDSVHHVAHRGGVHTVSPRGDFHGGGFASHSGAAVGRPSEGHGGSVGHAGSPGHFGRHGSGLAGHSGSGHAGGFGGHAGGHSGGGHSGGGHSGGGHGGGGHGH